MPGRAAGRMILRKMAHSLSQPSTRPARISTGSTPFTPATVLRMVGKNVAMKMTKIFPASPMPNQMNRHRNPGERRDRPKQLDHRIEDPFERSEPPHGEAQRNCDAGGHQPGGEHTPQAHAGVLEDLAVGHHPDEGFAGRHRRGQEGGVGPGQDEDDLPDRGRWPPPRRQRAGSARRTPNSRSRSDSHHPVHWRRGAPGPVPGGLGKRRISPPAPSGRRWRHTFGSSSGFRMPASLRNPV